MRSASSRLPAVVVICTKLGSEFFTSDLILAKASTESILNLSKHDFRLTAFQQISMNTTIDAPVEWVETIGQLRLPSKADDRLQQLMDRNNEGELAAGEREELESLVELSERLSLVRTEALLLLGRRPT